MRTLVALVLLALPVIAQPPDARRWRTTLTISDETDERAAELGKIFGLAVDKDGNIYAADIDNSLIAVFGPNGRFRAQVGRKGKGPGEFQSPTGIVIDDQDRLWVREIERVQRLLRDPRTGVLSRYESSFPQPVYFDWYNARASRMSATGDYFHTTVSGVIGAQARVHRYTRTGVLQDSVMVPRYPNESRDWARVMLSATDGRMLRGLGRVPFAAVPSWDVTPRGTIVSTGGDQYRIRETDTAGRMIREIVRSIAPVRIVPAERAESLAALGRRLDTLKVPLSQVQDLPDDVRQKRLPQTYPAIQSLFAEVDGSLWVRRWAGEGQRGTSVFDVFGADGKLLRSVILPAVILDAPTPVLGEKFVVAAVEDRETGGVRILRFEP